LLYESFHVEQGKARHSFHRRSESGYEHYLVRHKSQMMLYQAFDDGYYLWSSKRCNQKTDDEANRITVKSTAFMVYRCAV
jgi:hypothetical protein